MRQLLAAALGAAFFMLAGPAGAVDSDGRLPDRSLTECVVRTTSREEICRHSTREVRSVPAAVRVATWRAYGLESEFDGWCAGTTRSGKRGCEGDHWCPLGIGGGNPPGSRRFLFPQRPDGPYGYPVKDLCEARAHRAICRDLTMTPQQAQALFMRGDWRANCEAAFPDLKRLKGWRG
jgi:hypothetical protein